MTGTIYDHLTAVIITGALFVAAVIAVPTLSYVNLLYVDQQQLRNVALETLKTILLDTGYPLDWGSDGNMERFGLALSESSSSYVLDPDKVQWLVENNSSEWLEYETVRQMLGLQGYGFNFKIMPPFKVTIEDLSEPGLENLHFVVTVTSNDGTPIPNADVKAIILHSQLTEDLERNLLLNGDFEIDSNNDNVPDNWSVTAEGNVSYGLTNSTYTTGSLSLYASVPSGANITVRSDPFPVVPNITYVAKTYMKANDTQNYASLRIHWYDSDWNLLGSSDAVNVTLTANWKQYTGDVTSLSNASFAKAEIFVSQPTADIGINWDDIRFQRVFAPGEKTEIYSLPYFQVQKTTNELGRCEINYSPTGEVSDVLTIFQTTVAGVTTVTTICGSLPPNDVAEINIADDEIILTQPESDPSAARWLENVMVFTTDGVMRLYNGTQADKLNYGAYQIWNKTFNGLQSLDPVIFVLNFYIVEKYSGRKCTLVVGPHPNYMGSRVIQYGENPGAITKGSLVKLQRAVNISGMTYIFELTLWKEM